METHADQLFLQRSQPPGKNKNMSYVGYSDIWYAGTDYYSRNEMPLE